MQNAHNLSIEKEEGHGVWHLIVNGQRGGTFPTFEAWKAAAKETYRDWLRSLGVDEKTKIKKYIPRHPVPETNWHRAIIQLEKPKD